jgi:hypothetical protein
MFPRGGLAMFDSTGRLHYHIHNDQARGLLACGALLASSLGLVGCATVTLPPSDPNAPSLSYSFENTTTRVVYNTGGGTAAVVLATPGSDYNLGVHANNPGGVHSMSLTGSGSVICAGNQAPYTTTHPYNFTIPSQSATFPVQSGNQVSTNENLLYVFSWATGPTKAAYQQCGANVPLDGNVTYTATAGNYYGVNAQSSVKVLTCVASHGCTTPNF